MTTTKNKNHHHHQRNDIYEDVEKIKAALFDASQNIKGRATDMLADSVDDMKEKSAAVKNSVADYTADKPFKSLGFALLAGFLIGYFLNRK